MTIAMPEMEFGSHTMEKGIEVGAPVKAIHAVSTILNFLDSLLSIFLHRQKDEDLLRQSIGLLQEPHDHTLGKIGGILRQRYELLQSLKLCWRIGTNLWSSHVTPFYNSMTLT